MELNIVRFVVGSFGTNSYIIYNEKNNGFLIDPGANGKDILDYIRGNGINLKGIILTHGHVDHIGAVSEIKEELDIPIYIHQEESSMLEDSRLNLTSLMGLNSISLKADILLKDGDEIDLDGKNILVIHTPGHTKGGISLYVDNILFSGDTLFNQSIGRTDFPDGDYNEIINSIKGLTNLPEDTLVYSGHGPETTIGFEKVNNPFLK